MNSKGWKLYDRHQVTAAARGGQTPAPVMCGGQPSPCVDCALRTEPNLCGALFGDKGRRTAPNREMDRASLSRYHKVAGRRRTIYRSSELSNSIAIICEGWACVYMMLPDGGRQIISFLLPGDIVSAAAVFQDRSRFSVEAVTDLHYCVINKAELRAALAAGQKISDKFFQVWVERKEEVENLATDLGHRNAEQRIARLILRLFERHGARNMVRDNRFEFPLRLHHIADATGLTIVHAGRVIGTLRKLGLIEIRRRILTVLDPRKLQHLSNSEPATSPSPMIY